MKGPFLFAALTLATAAHAERATITLSDHSNFGSLVAQMNGPASARILQSGNRVEITVPGDTDFVTPKRVPRNVISFEGGHNTAILTVALGAKIKSAQSGHLIIVDVLDPHRRAKGPEAALTTARRNPLWAPPPPAERPQSAAPATVTPAPPEPTPDPAPTPPEAPELAAAQPAVPTTRILITVPAGPDIGAAALRRGNAGVVVFDDAVTPDLGADPETSGIQVLHRQGGTIVTVKLGDDETLAMAREDGDWVIRSGPVTTPPPAAVAAQASAPEGIGFQFARPGRTITISDPLTGQLLLLGTVRQPSPTQSLIDARRAAPGYVLLPTWLGLALEVGSDAVDLRVSQSGFTVQIPDKGAPGTAAAAAQDNPFQIPNAPTPVLMRQLDAQTVSAATSAPRNRGRQRLAVVRTMLALGLAQEAQALLKLAANDDPAIAADPIVSALQGIAAVLAGRPAEATGLDNADLPASSDIAMWRGVRDVAQGKPATMLGGVWPSLSTYPDAIRRQIAPPVLEAAIAAGDTVPTSLLEGPALAIARARQLEKSGEVDAAIEAYAAVAASRDERESVRATVALTELRLRQDKIKPADAAETLERQAVRWRGDAREEDLRFRAAELRRQARQWRAALDLLRETETLYPASKDRVATAIAEVFKALLAANDTGVNPLELVTIAGDYADRLPSGEDGEKLAVLLADKLAALDLPSRAIPVLKRLAGQAASPKANAAYAIRLAQLQLEAGDAASVEATLSTLSPDVLTPAQAEQRLLLTARTRVALGDPAGAAETLAQLDDDTGAEARAGLLAKAGNWRGSLDALKLAVAKSVPAIGELSETQQDLVLREATAAVHAADRDTLKQLKAYDGRLSGPRGDLFRVLTATAVESPGDLPRAAQELAMSRTVPDRINALKLR